MILKAGSSTLPGRIFTYPSGVPLSQATDPLVTAAFLIRATGIDLCCAFLQIYRYS
jgi:hypothetical protein